MSAECHSYRVVAVISHVALAALLLGGCVSPAFNSEHYQQQALMSVDAAQSELQTTRLVLEACIAGEVFATTADETVSASESAIASIAASFQTVQPPATSNETLSVATRYLDAANDAVVQSRIAVRRGDEAALRVALEHVERVLSRAVPVHGRLT